MGNSSWRARARLHRVWPKVAAVAGLSLVASMTTLAPAQAGLLDDLTDPVTDVLDPVTGVLDPITDPVTGEIVEPVVDTVTGVVSDPDTEAVLGILDPVTGDLLLAPLPDISSGAGTLLAVVDGALAELCDSAEAVCDRVPVEDLVEGAAIILKAVPAEPGSIPKWEGCPTFIADICMITADDLLGDTPLAPVVSFLPGGAIDPDAPETTITSQAPGKQAKTHTFTFEAEPSTEQTTFECRLEVAYKSTPPSGAQSSHDWQPCGADPFGSHTYPNEFANGTYVFAVQALEGDAVDQTPATQSWTVAIAPEVPETRIVAGPKGNSWLFTARAVFRFRSTVADSRFQCHYDSMTRSCDAGRFVWKPRTDGAPLRPGTSHVFKVAAMANKTQDFTPATRRFHIPFDDRALRPVNQWQRKKQRGHVRNTYSLTSVTGAALVTKRPQKFRRVVLIADKGRGFGTVKVFKGKQLLREVDLHAKKKLVKGKVIPVKRFKGKLRAGKIRVVVTSAGKPVRIDGLGVARR